MEIEFNNGVTAFIKITKETQSILQQWNGSGVFLDYNDINEITDLFINKQTLTNIGEISLNKLYYEKVENTEINLLKFDFVGCGKLNI